jgi:hypothetical protein
MWYNNVKGNACGALSFFIGKTKMDNIFGVLASGDNPLVAVLAFTVATLAGVIAYQWKYMADNTVPYKIHKDVIAQLDKVLAIMQSDFETLRGRINVNIQECQKTNAILNLPKK